MCGWMSASVLVGVGVCVCIGGKWLDISVCFSVVGLLCVYMCGLSELCMCFSSECLCMLNMPCVQTFVMLHITYSSVQTSETTL